MTLGRWSSTGRLERLLAAALILEALNLFSIAVTSGQLRLLPGLENRFASFALHSCLFWAVFVTRELAASSSTGRRIRGIMGARWLVLGACLVGASAYFQHGQRMSADGPHYFVQARSLLFDGDLDFANDYELVRAPKPIAARYPVGSALISLPFLALAHGLLMAGRALGLSLDPSGYGYAYETAFGIAGYFFASWSLLRVFRTTANLFPVDISLLALAAVASSTFLAWYMVVEPSMPHAMSFAWTSFFLCYWLAQRPFTGWRPWLLLGILAGVASLVRWQNGVLLALPLLDQVLYSRRSWKKAACSVLACAVCLAPQLLFWRLTASSAFAVPLEGHAVTWTQFSLLEVLYSTNRGLFPWNPILYLSIFGLLLWMRTSTRLALLFLAGFVMELYVNASVGIWWAGWAFGGRRFDSSILFFVAGTAAFFEFLRRRPFIPLIGLSIALATWNYGLSVQARRGWIPPDRLVSFRQVFVNNVEGFYERLGLPFAWPANWLFSWRFGVTPEKFDRLFGHEGFGNFRVDMSPASEPYAGRGWGVSEIDPQGRPFRWSVGDSSTILVPLKAPRDYQLEVELRPFGPVSPNQVKLSVNGSIERSQGIAELTVLQWRVPRDRWLEGVNELRFDFRRTAIPSELGTAEDPRPLGAAFYRVSLTAIPD